ncbi:surfactant-associated protein 2 [Acomys russatus]|uniref:surfactant-associated protein 2 n=1 Tax=Acomys russatus TaxID=60746 RepID=UPI0021E2BEC3|nr:surfactant-associated protein 2 [Acomys russatus]
MESSMHLCLLLALLSISHAIGPKVTLQVKLTEAFQAQDSVFKMNMLEKICVALHLPPGTDVTLHHTGPPYHLTCRV